MASRAQAVSSRGRTWPAALRSPAALLIALAAGGALISGFTILRRLDPFDEGLLLQAARRIVAGELPYRDFHWAYGPAQPYLIAGSFKLFGTSLLWWRIVRTAFDAGIALTVFALARRRAPLWAAVLAWLAAAAAIAEPTSANPMAGALLFSLLAVFVATGGSGGARRVLGAAALTALAAAWRIDFGIYAFAGVTAALALRPGRRSRAITVASYVAGAVGLTVLVYLPFLIAVGPHDMYEALIGKSLRDHAYWTLPFPLSYHGQFRIGHLLHDAKDLLDFYVPLLLVVGLALLVGYGTLASLRARRPALDTAALAVLGVGYLLYLRSRADEFHIQALLVLLGAGLPAAFAALWRGGRALRAGAAAVAVVFGLLLAHGVANRLSALTRPPTLVPVHVGVADGVEAPPREASALERVVRLVHARVPPGRPIYVAPRRSDLVAINDPLLYVLTERPNPMDTDFDLQTGASAQAQIVSTLRRVRPRVVIRWTDPISSKREPNRRGVPSGVHTLDRYLATTYSILEREGFYDVLVPRERGPAT